MLGSLRKLTFLDLGGCRWACGRPSIWEVEEVIASAECFVVASHIGINCAVSNEFVHLTLATAVPVSGSAFALLGSSGAETKFRVVALDSVQL